MRRLLVSVLFLTTMGWGAWVQALPLPPQTLKQFELMKCTAPKIGTLWVSFGRLFHSDEPQATYFPTEIAFFGAAPVATASFRKVYLSVPEALKVDLSVGPGHMHFGFVNANNEDTHLLQIMQYDMRLPHAYLGNWTYTTKDGKTVMDLAACSLD